MENRIAKIEGDAETADRLTIAFCADDYFGMPLAATVASIISNLGRERSAGIYIVNLGVSAEKRERVERLADQDRVTIAWLEPSDLQRSQVERLPDGFVGKKTYYKFFLPELLGPTFPKILYLDCDVIVESDLYQLWSLDPGEQYLLASQDLVNPFVSSPFGLVNWRELERGEHDPLFNSGVMVLNAAKWSETGVASLMVEYVEANRRYIQLCEQDALNAVFGNNWGRIDPLWNVLSYMPEAAEFCLLDRNDHERLIAEARVLHFCGTQKPWNGFCLHPRKDRFFHYLDQTDWSGWRPRRWSGIGRAALYYARRARKLFRRLIGSPF